MKPLLFPYTYVAEPVIDAYRHFFSGISVFQSSMKHIPEPMGQWVDQGFLDIQMPGSKVSRIFDKILAETENWARNHRGGAAAFLKAYQDETPFFGPSSVSRIRQDIREAGRTVSPDESQEDAVLRARVFLQIAQDFDAHNQWLSHQMQQQEAMEKKLYRELRGEEPFMDRATIPGQPWGNEEPFQYMILDRMKAWSRVMLSHGHVKGLLVTTAAAILDLIQEYLPDSEELILAATIPAVPKDVARGKDKRQDLTGYCEKLLRMPLPLLKDSGLLDTYPSEITDKVTMRLYLLPGMAPQSLFTRFVEGGVPDDRGAAVGVNTLIGYINKDISVNCQNKS